MEEEVFRDGQPRAAPYEGTGGREPSSQADVCGPCPGPQDPQGRTLKKVLRPCHRKDMAAYVISMHQIKQGLQGCQPAQVDVLLQEQEGRQRNDSETPGAGRSVSNRRTGPLLFTYPTRGTEVELQTNPQGV